MVESENFDSLQQSAINPRPKELVPSNTFPQLIFFHPGDTNNEISNRGIAQIGFEMFRSLYEQVSDVFDLPELSEQPEVSLYADGSFSVNWWGEIVYCKNSNNFIDHLMLMNDRFRGKHHKQFKEKGAQKFEQFRSKVEEVKRKLSSSGGGSSGYEALRQLIQQKEAENTELRKENQDLKRQNEELRAQANSSEETKNQPREGGISSSEDDPITVYRDHTLMKFSPNINEPFILEKLQTPSLLKLEREILQGIELFEESGDNKSIATSNNNKAQNMTKSLLKDKEELAKLGIQDEWCSVFCQGNTIQNMKLLDTLRIKLPCGCMSKHIQCQLVAWALGAEYLQSCPENKTEECKFTKVDGGKFIYGPLYFPTRKVFTEVFKAFLRSETLRNALLKEELL